MDTPSLELNSECGVRSVSYTVLCGVQVTPYGAGIWVNNGSGNSLFLGDTMPLLEPTLSNKQ